MHTLNIVIAASGRGGEREGGGEKRVYRRRGDKDRCKDG